MSLLLWFRLIVHVPVMFRSIPCCICPGSHDLFDQRGYDQPDDASAPRELSEVLVAADTRFDIEEHDSMLQPPGAASSRHTGVQIYWNNQT